MHYYTPEEAAEMDIETACTKIADNVYEATGLIELLEGRGKVIGNGHHHRQKAAALVTDLLKDVWRKS